MINEIYSSKRNATPDSRARMTQIWGQHPHGVKNSDTQLMRITTPVGNPMGLPQSIFILAIMSGSSPY